MFLPKRKVSLIYFVTGTLLLVGLVPLVLTGWFLSERSGRELRAVENRYQIQLVQEKARQIEMFGQKNGDLVKGLAKALQLSNSESILASPQAGERLGATLKENPNVLALYVKASAGEPLSLFRPNALSRSETETLAAAAIESLAKKDLAVSEPQGLGQSGEPVMTSLPQ